MSAERRPRSRAFRIGVAGWIVVALAIALVFVEPTTGLVLLIVGSLLAVVGTVWSIVSLARGRSRAGAALAVSGGLLVLCVLIAGFIVWLIVALSNLE